MGAVPSARTWVSPDGVRALLVESVTRAILSQQRQAPHETPRGDVLDVGRHHGERRRRGQCTEHVGPLPARRRDLPGPFRHARELDLAGDRRPPDGSLGLEGAVVVGVEPGEEAQYRRDEHVGGPATKHI